MDETPNIKSQEAIATATVQIIRAKTGKVETYDLTFTPVPDEPAPETKAEGA